MIKSSLLLVGCATLVLAASIFGQSNSGTIQGTVVDPSQALVPGAVVTIQNPVSHFSATVTTDSQGAFKFTNVPYNNYHLTAAKSGFQTAEQDVNLRSGVPVETKVPLKIGTASVTVEVNTNAQDLLETQPVTHTDVDRGLFDKVPLESASSSLTSLVMLTAPGVAEDSNGLMHGLGDHAENSFSIDGQPITDQQSKVFSNQLPVDAVQSLEVIAGAPPAEYGDKTSLVVVVTTRSGLGAKQPHGEITGSYGSFGTSNLGFNFLNGGDKWGNFISASGLNTGRFLDPPEFVVMHDKGNLENLFDRVDYKPNVANTFSLNVLYTRSWFQTPNSYDAQYATAWNGAVAPDNGLGPNGKIIGSADEKSKINTINIAPTYTRLISPTMVFTVGLFLRQDLYDYYPSRNPLADLSPDLQSVTIGQARRLLNTGLHTDLSIVKGIHNIKIGGMYEHTLLRETDTFGIVDPTLNAPCLNADGSPFTGSGVLDTSNCLGTTQSNPNFNPVLACYDLSRPGTLPADDGCPFNNSRPYSWEGKGDIAQFAGYIQDQITLKNWTFNIGVRFDWYNGIPQEANPFNTQIPANRQVDPRAGIAYNIKPTGTVLRVSYARTMETPFNENQVLASTGCNDPIINALQAQVQGYPCLAVPERPGRREEYHAGLSQAFGRYLVIDAEYITKYTHRGYDFSVLGSTPVTYPIEWSRSKIPGYAFRASVPNYHGLTAYVISSSVAARFFTPQVAGIGVTPTSSGVSQVFRIDHDENVNVTAHMQYQPFKHGPWVGFNWRYDSGLVAGASPCVAPTATCYFSTPVSEGGGADIPAGEIALVNTVNGVQLTADQEIQAGLTCGGKPAATNPLGAPLATCLASAFGSTLLQVPKPGTENDDHNPQRIASKNLFDIAIGHDNIFRGDRYKWSVRFAVVNLTNYYGLYNFLSTFSGTHYVTPRTLTATVGFHF
jgi:hypothetical protein